MSRLFGKIKKKGHLIFLELWPLKFRHLKLVGNISQKLFELGV